MATYDSDRDGTASSPGPATSKGMVGRDRDETAWSPPRDGRAHDSTADARQLEESLWILQQTQQLELERKVEHERSEHQLELERKVEQERSEPTCEATCSKLTSSSWSGRWCRRDPNPSAPAGAGAKGGAGEIRTPSLPFWNRTGSTATAHSQSDEASDATTEG